MVKRLAVLTSGGDAPGMNACIRSVVRAALDRCFDVVGVQHGFEGLFSGDFVALDRPAIVNIVHRGGTILGTSRSARMRTADGLADAVRVLDAHHVNAVVLIGGDGTFRGGAALEAAGGPPTVGIPGTIDNDVAGTDVTVGFDTAVNTALEAIDRVRDTATSHGMLHFVEVMGRRCGALALAAGLAGGAEAILVPESAVSDESLTSRIADHLAAGKRSVIVVVAEGAHADGTPRLAGRVSEALGLECRVSVLGHLQRGGPPTAADRILAALWGIDAVAAVADGEHGMFIGQRRADVVRVPYNLLEVTERTLDHRMIAAAELLA